MKLRSPLRIFLAVERALFLREMDMKISIGRSGLFWTFFEPFFQVVVFVALHVAIKSYTGSHGIGTQYNLVVFMASGFIAYNLFKNILSSSLGAFKANKALFVYKQVKPIDTLLGRVLVNIFLTFIVYLLFLFIGFIFELERILPENPLMVILSVFWLVVFSIGIGLLAAVGNVFFVSIGKIINISTYGLLIFSAVFYPLISLPDFAQEVLLYNPLTHFMEMIHAYYLEGLDDRFVDYEYLFFWTIIPLFLGLWLYTRLEKRIISS